MVDVQNNGISIVHAQKHGITVKKKHTLQLYCIYAKAKNY